MAKSANIYARIEPEVKKEAESILEELGIPVSVAINMFYKKIIASKGMPFEIKIEDSGITDITNMSEEDINNIIKYREEHGINDYGWVFVTPYVNENNSINNGTLNEWCKRIGNMIGVPTLHPHDFRHSYATLLKQENVSLEDISMMLNHSGTDVTQKFYIKKDTSKIRKIKDNIII